MPDRVSHFDDTKKTVLIDDFDLVWTKGPKFSENGSHLSQNRPQNRIFETSIGHKNSQKGLFHQKFQEGSM